MMMLTSGDWITIASCVLGSGTTNVIVQHLLDWLEETKRREETPEVKARNCISRHSALSMLKTVHRDAVARGWVPLDDLDEAQEIYNSYHTLGGNGAGSRIIHDLQQMENYPTNQSNQSE